VDRSPGGVGDGLPSLPTGEPVLHRWFVLAMIPLVLVGVVVTVWAFSSIRGIELPPAERRPPGTADVTHERGAAALAEDTTVEDGPECAEGVELVGDPGGRAAGRRALSALCLQLSRLDDPVVSDGLDAWEAADGVLRFAVFEVNGLDSSARVEDGRVVVELNNKFQFLEPGSFLAVPSLVHELRHLGSGAWPGAPVTAADELEALRAQAASCDLLVLRRDPPRGCGDAEELLADPDPLGAIVRAGYGSGG
jgi:hypothetical protein